MPLPSLSPEQRAAALEKAAEIRKARAELKEQLKQGKTTLAAVLDRAESDDVVGDTDHGEAEDRRQPPPAWPRRPAAQGAARGVRRRQIVAASSPRSSEARMCASGATRTRAFVLRCEFIHVPTLLVRLAGSRTRY